MFLGDENTLSVIIAANLVKHQVKALTFILRCFKSIGWMITDIIGIPPGIYTDKIQLEEDYTPC